MFQDDLHSFAENGEDELQAYIDSTMKPEINLLEWYLNSLCYCYSNRFDIWVIQLSNSNLFSQVVYEQKHLSASL